MKLYSIQYNIRSLWLDRTQAQQETTYARHHSDTGFNEEMN